jgi:cell division protein FtsI (penicillin-binding protein 3)
LESLVVADGATGWRAAIPGYRVSGKTGTAWKAAGGGYYSDHFNAVFGGIAPASAPRLAALVVLEDPSAGEHQGGAVSAPVFSAVVGQALRLLAVAPDQPINGPDDLPSTPKPAGVRTAALQ